MLCNVSEVMCFTRSAKCKHSFTVFHNRVHILYCKLNYFALNGCKHYEDVAFVCTFQICEAHLPSGQEASSHYKAVCRALVNEAQELVTFLETISVERHVS